MFPLRRLKDVASDSIFEVFPDNVVHAIFRTFRRSTVQACRERRFSAVAMNTYSLAPMIATKSVYVHVPKAAGLSVTQSLYGNRGSGHATLRDYLVCLTPEEFSSFFKFTLVRHPATRLYSAYKFLCRGGINSQDAEVGSMLLRDTTSFDDFVLNWLNPARRYSVVHFVPQMNFLRIRKNRADLDFLGYYERIETEFDLVTSRLGLDATLSKVNISLSRKSDSNTGFAEPILRRIYDLYRDDYTFLGYGRDPGTFDPMRQMVAREVSEGVVYRSKDSRA